ncbi:unnamed protein product [Caretta caretta]
MIRDKFWDGVNHPEEGRVTPLPIRAQHHHPISPSVGQKRRSFTKSACFRNRGNMDSFTTPVRTSDFILAPSTFGLVWRKRYISASSEEEEGATVGSPLAQPLMDTPEPETRLLVEGDRSSGESLVDKMNGKDKAQKQKLRVPLQVKLQGALGPLRKQLEECLALASKEEKKTTEWQDDVENWRPSITREFKKLHQFLRPAIELLKNMKSALIRSENVTLQQPGAVSPVLKNMYKVHLDMKEMLERFTVDVTLDPDTAHPNLLLSEDRKHVRHRDTRQDLPDNPERFDCCHCVLGAEGFTGGRCYWEVEVGDMTDWMLGVCRESVSRKGCVILTTENGYWAMWLWDGEYKVLTSPRTSLPVSIRPSREGIFLDYEAGEVSFYNVTDRSHLFTFTGTFSGTLHPYFCPGLNAGGRNAASLIICPVPAQAVGNLCP